MPESGNCQLLKVVSAPQMIIVKQNGGDDNDDGDDDGGDGDGDGDDGDF